MKKGCVASAGCSGVIAIILFAIIIIDFISYLNFSFDGFDETNREYSFNVGTLGSQPIITSDSIWRFTSSFHGRKSYKISF